MTDHYSPASLSPDVFLTKAQELWLMATGADFDKKACPLPPALKQLADAANPEPTPPVFNSWVSWREVFCDEPFCDLLDPSVPDKDPALVAEVARIKEVPLPRLFREILLHQNNASVDYLSLVGASTCPKLGGFSLIVTRDDYCWSGSNWRTVEDGKLVVQRPVVYRFADDC